MSARCEGSRHRRCYAEPASWHGTRVALEAEERHHLCRVLRAKRGDRVVVFDGQGREADARLENEREGVLEIAGEPRRSEQPSCRMILMQAIPKRRGMDAIVEKATELGAAELLPVVSERTVARPDVEKGDACVARWRRIATNAARQCGAVWTPCVREVLPFAAALSEMACTDALFLGCTDSGCAPVLAAAETAALRFSATVGLMIGPEGDWTDGEVERAKAAGAIPVGFGPLVLRVETAALFGLSVLAARFAHDFGSREPNRQS